MIRGDAFRPPYEHAACAVLRLTHRHSGMAIFDTGFRLTLSEEEHKNRVELTPQELETRELFRVVREDVAAWPEWKKRALLGEQHPRGLLRDA